MTKLRWHQVNSIAIPTGRTRNAAWVEVHRHWIDAARKGPETQWCSNFLQSQRSFSFLTPTEYKSSWGHLSSLHSDPTHLSPYKKGLPRLHFHGYDGANLFIFPDKHQQTDCFYVISWRWDCPWILLPLPKLRSFWVATCYPVTLQHESEPWMELRLRHTTTFILSIICSGLREQVQEWVWFEHVCFCNF